MKRWRSSERISPSKRYFRGTPSTALLFYIAVAPSRNVDHERGGPLLVHPEVPRESLVVLQLRLDAVRVAQRLLRDDVELVQDVLVRGVRLVVEQNELVADTLAGEDLARCLASVQTTTSTTLSL